MQKLQVYSKKIKLELSVYRRVLADVRTPWLSRILLGSAIAYLVSPIDLIPDFIPVLGQLDDLLIVPGLVFLALQCIPAEVVKDARDDKEIANYVKG